jgi:putative salt-induced outer membrane protein YdiY
VTLKNGDKITGTVKGMEGGTLIVTPAWGPDVKVNWSDVATLTSEQMLPIRMVDGSTLNGTLSSDDAGQAKVKTEKMQGYIKLGDIESVNPVVKPPVVFSGFIRLGATITDGNTRTREVSSEGQLVARADRLRLTLHGVWNYGEDRKTDSLYKRNALLEIKLDFFLSEKLYAYMNASFLGDKFQDLNLRSTFGAGLGYQWVENDTLKIFTEGGIVYVVEDFRRTTDERYLSARAAWAIDWNVTDAITFFHNGQVLPSVEDIEDVLVDTSTGFRFTFWDGFFASAQVDFKWDNTPAAGFGRRDIAYIFGIGYDF